MDVSASQDLRPMPMPELKMAIEVFALTHHDEVKLCNGYRTMIPAVFTLVHTMHR